MANTFKNAGVAITNSATVIYTAPASTTGVVHAIYISNIHASSDGTVDIFVTDTSAGTDFYIAKNLSVLNGSVAIFEKPLNLEATDVLKAQASANSVLQAFASVLEIA
jgi:hypothetical protein